MGVRQAPDDCPSRDRLEWTFPLIPALTDQVSLESSRRLNRLTPNQGARESQVLLRFFKVRLDAESLFVMSNG
jgi:hypothetical protein